LIPLSSAGFRQYTGPAEHVPLAFPGLLLFCAVLFWPGIGSLWWDSMLWDLIEENVMPLAL
jgi:hypothetical protein